MKKIVYRGWNDLSIVLLLFILICIFIAISVGALNINKKLNTTNQNLEKIIRIESETNIFGDKVKGDSK